MFKIDVRPEFTIKAKLEGANVSFTFKRLNVEDAGQLAEESLDVDNITMGQKIGLMYKESRISLIGWTGIHDEATDEALPSHDAEGNIIEVHQRAVFDLVVSTPKLWNKYQVAKSGLSAKNLKTGAKQ